MLSRDIEGRAKATLGCCRLLRRHVTPHYASEGWLVTRHYGHTYIAGAIA